VLKYPIARSERPSRNCSYPFRQGRPHDRKLRQPRVQLNCLISGEVRDVFGSEKAFCAGDESGDVQAMPKDDQRCSDKLHKWTKMGKESAPRIETSETYRLSTITRINTVMAASAARGTVPRKTPNPVVTALPPPKPKPDRKDVAENAE